MALTPNKAQRKAIEHPAAPLMIIAGAGTGKTSTLILRIAHMINTNIAKPEQIIVLTFTDRATEELRQKVRDSIGKVGEDVVISTFHGFCNRLVREFGISDSAEKLLWQENDLISLLVKRFDDLTFLTSRIFRADPISAIRRSFIPFFNRIRDELLSPEDIREKYSNTELSENQITSLFPGTGNKIEPDEIMRQFTDLVKVYKKYQEWKIEMGVVDYGDMILDCWQMLSKNPDILKQVRQRYHHIIIDEYQDNNFALNKIVNLIAAENPSITVVGDEDQSIYSFRGANYYNIQDFESRYKDHPGYDVATLEENYRSTQEILDLANISIAHNRNRIKKTLVSSKMSHGPKPIWHVSSRAQTLSEIPQLVNELVTRSDYQFGNIAIICRMWGHVKAVADVLKHASIPVDVHVEKFFSVSIVKEVLAWSHLIVDSTRTETALYRILRTHLGEHWVELFYREHKRANAEERFAQLSVYLNNGQLTENQIEKLSWILDTREILMRQIAQNRKVDEMVWAILKALKKTGMLRETRDNYRYSERLNLVNCGYLMSLADAFVIREDEKSLKAWLGYMDVLQLDLGMAAIQPETYDASFAVQVITVHRSKGLQFPVVFVPFLRQGSFPSNRKVGPVLNTLPDPWKNWPKPENITVDEDHLNEERRVFYVAITRAKDQLHLFGPDKAQSCFTKELESAKTLTMEIQPMTNYELLKQENEVSELKQRLLVELSREIAAHSYDNAKQILDGLRSLDYDGTLPENHPYTQLAKSADGKKVAFKLDRILKLSASSVEEYNSCPLKYRLSKIDKVPERKSKVTMEFGIIIHNVLDEFHGLSKQTFENLLKLLEKHWRQEAFDYLLREEEFKRQGIQLLQDYYNYIQEHPPQVVSRESHFDFVIEDLNIQITGKIDRIDRDGDRLAVVDYKTSKNKESAKQSLQLALYIEALRKDSVEGISGKSGMASLHFLRHPDDPLSTHEFTEPDLMMHLRRVGKVADGIRKGEFEPKPDDYKCRNCDYREFLCPSWEEI